MKAFSGQFTTDTTLKKKTPTERFLLWAIVLVTLSKLSLMGPGFMSNPDEFRYLQAGVFLEKISQGKVQPAIKSLFSAQGRPGEILIKLIPSALQSLSADTLGLDMYESRNSFPLFLFNFMIYILVLWMLYRLGHQLLKDHVLALSGVLLYSLLVNSHIYLRHALPYDTSLLILLFSINRLLGWMEKGTATSGRLFGLGALSIYGFLTYPGYLPLFLVCGATLVTYGLDRGSIGRKLLQGMYFAAGSLSLLVFIEWLSRVGGNSYIWAAQKLSSTILHGSHDETFSFLFKYLIQVESLNGAVLILGLCLFFLTLAVTLFRERRLGNKPMVLLALFLTLMFVSYAGAGVLLRKVVFYGRLLHMYLPFICIFSVYALQQLVRTERVRDILTYAFTIPCIIHFFLGLTAYNAVSYPRDMGWDLINTHPTARIITHCEYGSWSVLPERTGAGLQSVPREVTANDKSETIHFVNGCYFWPVRDMSQYRPFAPSASMKLIETKDHFVNYKGYQYEGYGIQEREHLDSMHFKISVYSE